MAGTTPNRGYPFPTDGDGQNTAVDMEQLARAVDLDAVFLDDKIDAEGAARAATDVALQNNINNIIHVGDVDHGILVQASLGQAVTDEVGKHLYTFPIPFSGPPIVVANNADRDMAVMVGVEHGGVTASQCVVFAKKLTDGTPAVDTNIAWHWIAVGFRTT